MAAPCDDPQELICKKALLSDIHAYHCSDLLFLDGRAEQTNHFTQP